MLSDMNRLRPFLISMYIVSATIIGADFTDAASGIPMQTKSEILSWSIENTQDSEQIKEDIQAYIIESYKIQGTKILKDLDGKLQKTIPNSADRKEAYIKIKASLELRKKRIEDLDASKIKKEILAEFLDHMIHSIDKKIEEFDKE